MLNRIGLADTKTPVRYQIGLVALLSLQFGILFFDRNALTSSCLSFSPISG